MPKDVLLICRSPEVNRGRVRKWRLVWFDRDMGNESPSVGHICRRL